MDSFENFLTRRVFTGKCWFSQNYFSSISFPANTSFFVPPAAGEPGPLGSVVPALSQLSPISSSLRKIGSLPGRLESWTPRKSLRRPASCDSRIQLNPGSCWVCRGCAKGRLLRFSVCFSSVSALMGSVKENPWSMDALLYWQLTHWEGWPGPLVWF